MRYSTILLSLFLILTPMASAQQAEPWKAAYTADDASGDHVIAFWNFEGDGESVSDVSGNGHNGTLDGAERRPEGRFGRGMASFAGWPVSDQRHAVIVPDAPALSPNGAFTLELWLRPDDGLADYGAAYLVDKKYVAHTDYQWILDRPDKQGLRNLRLVLGFGEDSETWYAEEPLALEAGTWYHLAVTYNGAGTARFLLNGRSIGGNTKVGRGIVTPGTHLLSLGDRIGSYYHGFPGDLDEIRITEGVREFRPMTVAATHIRRVYRRMEADATLEFALKNVSRNAHENVRVTVDVGGDIHQETIPSLEAGATQTVTVPLDTSLRPGDYDARVAFALGDAADAYRNEEAFPVTIVPRPLPNRMPVVMWGLYGVENVTEGTPLLKDIGFTHCLGLRTDYGRIWEAGEPVPSVDGEALQASYRMLDQALKNDLGIIASLGNGHWMDEKEDLLRVNRNGEPYERVNPCCLFPGIEEFSQNVGASVAQTFGGFPAFEGALINTEVRDSTQVCFHDHDRAAYRDATGNEYPALVRIKNGVPYGDIEGFPENRVVPDDHELLQFYRWFWKDGDGWNPVHSAVNNGLKSTPRDDLWTFFDPAVRVPSLWGSGGNVDYLSHWTYTYPDPIRIGLATDELFAMAGGKPDQSVMKMTQIIWYRSQTAPAPDGATADGAQSAWEDRDPDAAYITIAPMHLKEAFWLKMARPIQGIMYHGWQSLVPTESTSAYRYTHPETRHVLKELIATVVEPLGPTLRQVPAAPAKVAFLESFTSQMFARRGTYGWGRSWAGDAYHILRYAHLQPEIVYEETIQNDGLDAFKVLVLTDCDVLPESVVEAVHAFQQAGGIVVGDERLSPAITPDITLAVYDRTKDAAADKAALLQRASDLRAALADRYAPFVQTSVADVLPYRRQYQSTDYVFAVNDRREYGTYVGQHGLVMENGLPAEASVTVQRGGHVYDLLSSRPVDVTPQEGTTRIPLTLEPGGGRVFMITDKPLDNVTVAGPEEATPSSASKFTVNIVGPDGTPLDAIVPVEVTIQDPDGRRGEFSGYYGATGGTLNLGIDHAPNDTPGVWTITVRELASGKTGRHFFRLSGHG